MAIVYLIRHGQASFHKSDYDKLTELGVQQSKYVGSALKDRGLTAKIVTSGPLTRHLETADHCLRELGLKVNYPISDNWNEYDHNELISTSQPEFAEFEALKDHIKSHPVPLKALQDILNKSILDWMENKHTYSVSWSSYKQSAWQELERIARQLKSRENAIVFTSGGPISAIVMKALRLKDEQFIDLQNRMVNTSITKILVGKSGLSVSTYNDYGHLEHDFEKVTYR